MSKVKTDSIHYVRIADAMRKKTGTQVRYKPSEMPDGVDEVFSAGENSEYSRFWRGFMMRSSYAYAFYGVGWNDITFNPPGDIVPVAGTNAASMFQTASITDTKVSILLSGTTGCNYMFYDAKNLETVRGLRLGKGTVTNCFTGCSALKNLTMVGEIAQNGFNLQWSPLLSHDSIVGIVTALSSNASGLSVTLSKSAVDNAFETAQGGADGSTSSEWAVLVNTKSNWTINLV